MTTIGEMLANARRQQRATVKDVEKAIKIRGKYISALERNAFDEIAGEAYVIGFLKTYAQWLNLDPEPLIERYRHESRADAKGKSVPPAAEPLRNNGREGEPNRLVYWVATVMLLGAVLLVILKISSVAAWR